MGVPTADGLYGYSESSLTSLHDAMLDGRLHEVRSHFADVVNSDMTTPVYEDLLIKTAAGKKVYVFMRFQSKGDVLFRLFESPTLTGGFEDFAYSVNRASTDADPVTTRFFKNDPISPIAVTSSGITIVNREVLSPEQGPMVPGAIGDPLTPSYILDGGTDYLVRLANHSGITLNLQIVISFYEEDIL